MSSPREPHQAKCEGKPTLSSSPKTNRKPHLSSKLKRASNMLHPKEKRYHRWRLFIPSWASTPERDDAIAHTHKDVESHLPSPTPTLRDHQPHSIPEENKRSVPGSIRRRLGRGRDERQHWSMRLQKGRHQVPASENQPRPAGRKILPA
jgi:hypothetical protein